MLHDFTDELAYSHSQADAPWWEQVYRAAFPDMLSSDDLRDKGWHQKAGRDRAIHLTSGRTLYVDEKVRRKAYPDIALEVWSIYPKGGSSPYPKVHGAEPGWARKPLDCDFLAYAFEPIQTCYMFPFFSIRAAMEKHGGMFRDKADAREDGYRWAVAPNQRYDTISVAVPIRSLQECVTDAMIITWTQEVLPL